MVRVLNCAPDGKFCCSCTCKLNRTRETYSHLGARVSIKTKNEKLELQLVYVYIGASGGELSLRRSCNDLTFKKLETVRILELNL